MTRDRDPYDGQQRAQQTAHGSGHAQHASTRLHGDPVTVKAHSADLPRGDLPAYSRRWSVDQGVSHALPIMPGFEMSPAARDALYAAGVQLAEAATRATKALRPLGKVIRDINRRLRKISGPRPTRYTHAGRQQIDRAAARQRRRLKRHLKGGR